MIKCVFFSNYNRRPRTEIESIFPYRLQVPTRINQARASNSVSLYYAKRTVDKVCTVYIHTLYGLANVLGTTIVFHISFRHLRPQIIIYMQENKNNFKQNYS